MEGQCFDKIAEILSSAEEPYFKVDQRSLRDRIKKLLKLYVEKRKKEMRASGIELEHRELDDLLLDIHERQQQIEAAEASEAINKKLDRERQEAEETRRLSMERLSETQKRRNFTKAEEI